MAERIVDQKGNEDETEQDEEDSLLGEAKDLIYSINKEDTTVKLITTCVVCIVIPTILVLVKYFTTLGPISLLGFLLVALHLNYFITLYVMTFSANNLFRIRSQYVTPQQWLNMTLASNFKIHKSLAIESISEMSANRGSVLNYALYSIGVATYLTYIVFFIYRSGDVPTIDFALMGGAPLGILLIAFWEKDDSNKFHTIMHFLGIIIASLSNIGLLVAYSDNPQLRMVPIALIIFGITSSILYAWFLFKKKLPSNDPAYINSLSKKLIIFESFALAASLIAYDIYLLLMMPMPGKRHHPPPRH